MSDPLPKTLRIIAAGDLCAGCGACEAISGGLQMRLTDEGYLRPAVTGPVSAAEEAQIAEVCPGLSQTVETGDRNGDVLFGPYVEMTEGWATDAGLRHHGSSGGVLSALAAFLVSDGIVDRVLTTGADLDDPVGNRAVAVTDRGGAEATAGSRYAPSAPLAEVCDLPDTRHALIGKPCDIVAFRKMAARDPDLARRVPLVLSFFCAGVPSRDGALGILEALGVDQDDVETFSYRGKGWPGRATATLRDGTQKSMSYHDSWGRILSGRVQTRCKLCADGTGVAADIVCADAWETDADGYPVFEERDGVSLIVARTETGRDVLARAVSAGAIEMRPFDPATLPAMQPGQVRRRQALLARLAGRRALGKPVPRYTGLDIGAAARTGSPRWIAQNFIGTVRRGLKRR